MSRAELTGNRLSHPRPELRRELVTRRHEQKQDHILVEISRPPSAHTQSILDLLGEECQEEVIDLGGTEADASGLQEAVGAAQHQHSAGVGGDTEQIAVVPDAREAVKVRGAVFLLAVGAPELDWHAGEGAGANQVTDVAGGRGLSGVGVDGDRHAEADCLGLAGVDGDEGVGGAKEGDNVGAAGDGAEGEVWAEGAVYVLEGGGCEDGGGRVDCLQRLERVFGLWEGIVLF